MIMEILRYEFIFKSGYVEVWDQEVTYENESDIAEVNQTIQEALKDDICGCITFTDEKQKNLLVRLSDLSSVKITVIEN